MGALAPLSSSWIPEDDLLLKNAVEAGASLESLAKGAVQFSRKYTVRELQDRWHSLLYDPIVSAEASFHMNEFERSATTLPSKFSRPGSSREDKFVSGKRKVESVRNCYYALRKRIRNEPFNPMDLTFLIAPTDDNYVGNEHCILGDHPVSDQFGFQESNTDMMQCSFPEIRDDINTNGFHPEFHNTIQEDYSVEHDNIHTEIPQICGVNIAQAGTVIEEFGGPKDLPTNNDHVNGSSNFDGEHNFSSPITGCAASFHNLEYLSSEMPIWKSVEGVSPPTIQLNMQTEDTYILHGDGDAKNTCLSEFDMHGDSNLELEIPSEDMKTLTGSTEVYLAELSNSLLNFTNEEELLFTDDGKDTIDKSYYDGLSSLLLSSPIDANQDHMVDITQPEVNLDSVEDQAGPSHGVIDQCLHYVKDQAGPSHGGLDQRLDYVKDQAGPSHGGINQDEGPHLSNDVAVNSEVQLLSTTSASNTQIPEQSVDIENMLCTLNTEDPEIPCNDDVVFTNHVRPITFSSVARRCDVPKLNPSTVKDFSSNLNTNDRVLTLTQKEREPPAQSLAYPHIIRSQVVSETGSLHPVGDNGIKIDLPISSSSHRSVGNASKDADAETLLPAKLKEETPVGVAMKHFNHNVVDCSKQKPAVGLNDKSCSQSNAVDVNLVPDPPQQIQQASQAELGSVDFAASEYIPNDQVLDTEESPLEGDDDVPYFSDIEAMILDMDLDPEDQDLYSSDEVLRYQQEDTKRTIMRLEQGAHSYMQRAIASQGAFAVLYGRHSKHYIKKPEVLLGRGTEGYSVDIDLWREGRANKVSRRQATINLDKSGSFHLRNLGKCPILVNDKEIVHRQSLSLPSSCLIEIRGMPFIFETNHARVEQYLGSITQQN